VKDWGEDNFANDSARAYLGLLAAKLVATITEIFADSERLALDEDGEGMFMPSVELLALLCERYDVAPPKADLIDQWAERYLAQYDETIDRQRVSAGFKAARRRVIDTTFRWLRQLASTYWDAD
jgi:hypothetical protein